MLRLEMETLDAFEKQLRANESSGEANDVKSIAEYLCEVEMRLEKRRLNAEVLCEEVSAFQRRLR